MLATGPRGQSAWPALLSHRQSGRVGGRIGWSAQTPDRNRQRVAGGGRLGGGIAASGGNRATIQAILPPAARLCAQGRGRTPDRGAGRFRDCAHGDEPGCAVWAALADGDLDQQRFARFVKLQREPAYLVARQEQKVRLVQKERGKKLAKSSRQYNKDH